MMIYMRGVSNGIGTLCQLRLYRIVGRSKAIIEHKFDRKQEHIDDDLS